MIGATSGIAGSPGTCDEFLSAAYEANADRLVRRMLAVTHDPALAEDLVQEAFARLIVECQAGRTPDNVGGWLHRVAMNLLASRARHAKVADRFERQLCRDWTDQSPEDVVARRELARGLRSLLDALPPADRTAILMAAEGRSALEIGQRLGRTGPAARTLLCRARSKVRLELASEG